MSLTPLLIKLAFTSLFAPLFLFGCAPEKGNDELDKSTTSSSELSTKSDTTVVYPTDALRLKLKKTKTTKRAQNGAVVKAVYNVVDNPRSLPNLASINRQLENRVDSLYLDFSNYYSDSNITPQKDTVVIVFGNGSIWSDKIVSVMLDAEFYGLGIDKEPITTKWYGFLHFQQNSGRRLKVSDIFNEGMGLYWDRWVEQNIKPDYDSWDFWEVAKYINGELVQVNVEEYYRRLYTGGNFLIKEDGSVEFNFSLPGETNEVLYTITLPYEEIKQFYKTLP